MPPVQRKDWSPGKTNILKLVQNQVAKDSDRRTPEPGSETEQARALLASSMQTVEATNKS